MSFYPESPKQDHKIYLGVGYKKDKANFWSAKHWGNKNFSWFVKIILHDDEVVVTTTGNILDWNFVISKIKSEVDESRFETKISNLDEAFKEISTCSLYVGNDTGMMHVAASMGIPCISVFNLVNSYTKNRPWGNEKHLVVDGTVIDDTWPVVIDYARELLR